MAVTLKQLLTPLRAKLAELEAIAEPTRKQKRLRMELDSKINQILAGKADGDETPNIERELENYYEVIREAEDLVSWPEGEDGTDLVEDVEKAFVMLASKRSDMLVDATKAKSPTIDRVMRKITKFAEGKTAAPARLVDRCVELAFHNWGIEAYAPKDQEALDALTKLDQVESVRDLDAMFGSVNEAAERIHARRAKREEKAREEAEKQKSQE